MLVMDMNMKSDTKLTENTNNFVLHKEHEYFSILSIGTVRNLPPTLPAESSKCQRAQPCFAVDFSAFHMEQIKAAYLRL
jgi:hypothetical protein